MTSHKNPVFGHLRGYKKVAKYRVFNRAVSLGNTLLWRFCKFRFIGVRISLEPV